MHSYFFHLMLIILAFFSPVYASSTPYQAIIIAPIADLVGQPMANSMQNGYSTIPICGIPGNTSCLRIHQALLHEQVTILDENEDEVKLQIKNLFFETPTQKHETTYWTLKKNIVSLRSLQAKGIDINKLPKPITFISGTTKQTSDTVSLMYPYKDTKYQRTLSAGTRFIKTPNQSNAECISVYTLTPYAKKIEILHLPSHICLIEQPTHEHQARTLFVQLVSAWANHLQGFIPYVWGGRSFTELVTSSNFTHHHNGWYFLPQYTRTPYAGFDCAGLIARAAQLVGLPYFYKNTSTLAKHLLLLRHEDNIKPGDLLWFNGHVIILADPSKNLCIEARGYSQGFGKVQTILLEHLFKNIKTMEELKTAFLTKKPLDRLDSTKQVCEKIKDFKILKLV